MYERGENNIIVRFKCSVFSIYITCAGVFAGWAFYLSSRVTLMVEGIGYAYILKSYLMPNLILSI